MGCIFCLEYKNRMLWGIANGKFICTECCEKMELLATPDRILELVQLCHPDRHQGPLHDMAKVMTQWLLSLRPAKKKKT